MKKNKKIEYLSALKELEEILGFLQSEVVDIDKLSSKVKRAVELVEYCRKKINSTEIEVKKVLAKFEESKESSFNEGTSAD